MRKVTRANELFSTINYKQAEIELCECGEDAVGTDIHGRPACKFHSSPHEPFKPKEVLPVWEITPEDARLAKKHSVKTSMNLDQRYANDGYGYAHRRARDLGASDEQVMDAHARGIKIGHYADALYAGASHEEVLDAHELGVNIWKYARARSVGASDEQVMDAHARGINLVDYADARHVGASHEQVISDW